MYLKHKPKPVSLQGDIDTTSPDALFKHFDNKIKQLFKLFNIKTLLNRVGISKSQGYSTYNLLYLWVLHPFLKKRRTALWSHEDLKKNIQAEKDTFYRFVRCASNNWRNLAYNLFLQIQRHLNPVPYKDRLLVVDTTLIKKTGPCIEFVSRMYDHVSKSHIVCFPTLFLGYFDGRSFFPLDFSISATKKRLNMREKEVDKRSCGYRRRKEAKSKTTDNLLSMLQRAYDRGVDAGYVLFDSWFSHDVLINGIVNIGYHVVCRCKIGRVKYRYNGHDYTAKRLFSRVVKKRMKWNHELGFYAASIQVNLPHTGKVTLVFCQSERRAKFSLFLSTDTDLEITEILQKYAKRWSIEMFFRDAKQHLWLGKEQNRDFDAIIAHNSLVIIRYQLLSFMIRFSTGREAIGPLFETMADEVAQNTIIARLWEYFKYLLLMSSQILFSNDEKQTVNKLIDYIENTIGSPIRNLMFEGAKL
jgi:hypothetical protein